MVKLRKGRRAYTPSSTLGIMRFFDTESKAPKVSPELVVAIAIAFVLIILVLQVVAL